MKARFKKYELQFKRPAGTSRGVYTSRPVWFLFLEENGIAGIGECAPLAGLSKETPRQVENLLNDIVSNPQQFIKEPILLEEAPSVRFAFETALLDLQNGGHQLLFPSDFTEGKAGIPINGLIWMGKPEFMHAQIEEKLNAGYHCLKLKIGVLDFEKELDLLRSIRSKFSKEEIILRVDANGALSTEDAYSKLEKLAELDIHSIEQPIAARQRKKLAELCNSSPIPIALDEELIGINKLTEKKELLDLVRPQFLVLKPSLHGGMAGCDEWIQLAEERNMGWWITSYLESNVGLNAIAQWTYTKNVKMHQGLGTGQLFTNNVNSPLEIRGEQLWFDPNRNFKLSEII